MFEPKPFSNQLYRCKSKSLKIYHACTKIYKISNSHKYMDEIKLVNACNYQLIQSLQKVILNHNVLMLFCAASALDTGPKIIASYDKR